MKPDPSLLLSTPAHLPRWVFLHEKAYQVRDTAIESSVVTKVKGFGQYANRVMDVSDYVTPPQVGPDAGSVEGEGERQEEGRWDSQTRICGISHPESPAWQLGAWGSMGLPSGV